MIASRPNLQKKKLVMLGCEGKSERAYAALLNRFIKESNLPVRIRSLSLEHASDPLSRVQLLLRKVQTKKKQFHWMGILLDSDQTQGERANSRAQEARRLARARGINLIWQNPCHEGLLLKHMPGQEKSNPSVVPTRRAGSSPSGLSTRNP